MVGTTDTHGRRNTSRNSTTSRHRGISSLPTAPIPSYPHSPNKNVKKQGMARPNTLRHLHTPTHYRTHKYCATHGSVKGRSIEAHWTKLPLFFASMSTLTRVPPSRITLARADDSTEKSPCCSWYLARGAVGGDVARCRPRGMIPLRRVWW